MAQTLFEFFSDRLEITSMGGLPYGVSKDDFFSGFSVPRNKEIMRVFRDLEIVEHLGSGIPRILKTYGKEAFEIRESFLRVVFKYAYQLEGNPVHKEIETTTQTTTQKILEILGQNPFASRRDLATMLGDITENGVKYHLKKLSDQGAIRRVGPHNGGCWEIVNPG